MDKVRYKVSCCTRVGGSAGATGKNIPKPHSYQDLKDLQYCKKCNSIRCLRCTSTKIVTKYCPHCMTQASTSFFYCRRNCFLCPKCDNQLRVSSKTKVSREDPKKVEGKLFQLNCRRCEWQYSTGYVSKPQPLYKIINEQRTTNDRSQDSFKRLTNFYIKQEQVLRFLSGTDVERSMMKIDLLREFTALEIARLSRSKTKDEFFNAIKLNPSREDNEFKGERISPDLFPKQQPLRSKISYTCKKCNETIVCPSSDPLSSKYSIRNSLNDLFPRVSITSPRHNGRVSPLRLHTGVNYILASFRNFQKEEIEVSLSTFEKYDRSWNPLQLENESDSEIAYTITLPCSQFTLGGIPEKLNKPELIVKTIPTAELTELTKVSKVELFKRNQDSVKRISMDPNDENDDLGLSLMDLKDPDEFKPLDSGANWSTIPIRLCVSQSDEGEENLKGDIELPLFMTVKSKKDSITIGSWIKLTLGPLTD